jgi:hypothetical protein
MDFMARGIVIVIVACQARVHVFSFEQSPLTLSALPNNTVDSPFVRTLSFAFLAAHVLTYLAHRLALP